MKTIPTSLGRVRLLPTVSCALLLGAAPSHAESIFNKQEIYRRGNAISEKVSGFFGRVFNGNRTQQQQQSAPQYQQAPRQGQSQPQRTASTPAYQQAPSKPSTVSLDQAPAKSKSNVAANTTAKKTTRSATASTTQKTVAQHPATKKEPAKSATPERPVYASTKTRQVPVDHDNTPTKPASAPAKESVVYAPQPPSKITRDEVSPPATKPAQQSSAPIQAPSNNSTTTIASNKPANQPAKSATPPAQEFPTGTFSGKPGRVVSPYAPHNALDVHGLPSGSLALDPTTQKVFKVP